MARGCFHSRKTYEALLNYFNFSYVEHAHVLLLGSLQAHMRPHQYSTHNLILGDSTARSACVRYVGSRGVMSVAGELCR